MKTQPSLAQLNMTFTSELNVALPNESQFESSLTIGKKTRAFMDSMHRFFRGSRITEVQAKSILQDDALSYVSFQSPNVTSENRLWTEETARETPSTPQLSENNDEFLHSQSQLLTPNTLPSTSTVIPKKKQEETERRDYAASHKIIGICFPGDDLKPEDARRVKRLERKKEFYATVRLKILTDILAEKNRSENDNVSVGSGILALSLKSLYKFGNSTVSFISRITDHSPTKNQANSKEEPETFSLQDEELENESIEEKIPCVFQEHDQKKKNAFVGTILRVLKVRPFKKNQRPSLTSNFAYLATSESLNSSKAGHKHKTNGWKGRRILSTFRLRKKSTQSGTNLYNKGSLMKGTV